MSYDQLRPHELPSVGLEAVQFQRIVNVAESVMNDYQPGRFSATVTDNLLANRQAAERDGYDPIPGEVGIIAAAIGAINNSPAKAAHINLQPELEYMLRQVMPTEDSDYLIGVAHQMRHSPGAWNVVSSSIIKADEYVKHQQEAGKDTTLLRIGISSMGYTACQDLAWRGSMYDELIRHIQSD